MIFTNRTYKDSLFRKAFERKEDLLDACHRLREYSRCIATIRAHEQSGGKTVTAVMAAIEECIEKGYLADIADAVDAAPETVEKICREADRLAPDCTPEQIYEELFPKEARKAEKTDFDPVEP